MAHRPKTNAEKTLEKFRRQMGPSIEEHVTRKTITLFGFKGKEIKAPKGGKANSQFKTKYMYVEGRII
jgi:hypothetical protein